MSSPQFSEIFGARYMRDFQCIGSDCPDTCCAGWKIEVDKSHYKKIKKKLATTSTGKQLFNKVITRARGGDANDLSYAIIATDKNNYCSLLDEEHLCSLQRQFGETTLPNTCASYPRSMIARGSRLEVYGVMSCPVVAESVLFSENPFDLLDIIPSEGVKRPQSIRYSIQEGDAYDVFFDDIRGFVLNVLVNPAWNFEQKVYVLSRFAADIHGYYYRGCNVMAGPKLAEVLKRYQQTDMQQQLASECGQIPESMVEQVNEVMALLMAGMQSVSQANSSLRSYVDDLLKSAGVGSEDQQVWSDQAASQFYSHYQNNKSCNDGQVWQSLDQLLLRYSINHWLSVPYLISETLLGFIQNWVLRMASLRLLIMGHPGWQQAEMSEDQQKQLMLSVFQQYGRGIESRPAYIHKILEYYKTGDALTALAQTLLFLKI